MKALLLLLISATAQAKIHNVQVQDNNFLPANLTIEAGDTVRWENTGNNIHNVASQDFNFNFRCANGCDDNGGDGNATGQGWISEVTFHNPTSSIPYVCEPHSNNMTGSIKVLTPSNTNMVSIDPVNGFQPQHLTIFKGSKVLFVNQAGEHNMKADNDSFQCADGCADDGIEGYEFWTGQTWQVYLLFNQLGTITYHCENPAHTESGSIIVIDEPPIFANSFE